MPVLSYRSLAAEVLTAPPRLGRVRLVGVDGPTGSGKSTFADRLVRALAALTSPVTVLRTDDLLDGWQDTVTFWPRLDAWVLAPLRAGRPGTYRTYDWYAGRFGDASTTVPASGVLVLDGVTSTRKAVAGELALSVWMQVPYAQSVDRAIARDGAAASAELRSWHERERPHFAADDTAARADLVVDGAPTVPHSPEDELVALRGCPA